MSTIPEHKHSDKELSDLRARSAMQAANSPIVTTYNKKLASKGIVILGYALPLTAPLWSLVKKMTKDTVYEMSDFWIMAVPIILALVIALWIAIKRELSRHNSAFILIISLLCSFVIISAVNSDKYLKYELMSMIGKDVPMPVNETEDESRVNHSADTLTEEEREQLREYDRRRKAHEAQKLVEPKPTSTPTAPSATDTSTAPAPAIPEIPKVPATPAPITPPETSAPKDVNVDPDKAPEPTNPGIE